MTVWIKMFWALDGTVTACHSWRCHVEDCSIVEHQPQRKISLQQLNTDANRRRRHQRVVIKDRSVTPVWPHVVDLFHRSADGVSLLSLQSWPIHRLFGRPGRRFQLCSGGWPRVRSTWHQNAWCAGVSSESLATWPKTEFWGRFMRFDTGPRPVCTVTSEFLRNGRWLIEKNI